MRPKDRKYTQEHEWVLDDGGEVVIGITDYASEELGDIVYLDLPAEGTEISAGESLGSIETVKAVEEIYAPVSGKVIAVNADLADNPEKVNESPFEDGWFLRVAPSGDSVDLLEADDYDEMISGS